MKRRIIIVAVLLLQSGAAFGQAPGEVVSYKFQTKSSVSGGPNFIVPTGGFVLTDIVAGNDQLTYFVYRDQTIVMEYRVTPETHTLAMTSGIPFEAGTGFTITSGPQWPITVSGYIPCSNPCNVAVPTIGEWGTVFLMMLILTGGTVVFARRSRATSLVQEGES